MPVCHIGLTVSHLPTSCSFFLAALQPLGYRFLGQWRNEIGLGVHEADFFLTQETPGTKTSAAHVAFSASSRTMVREFYANALQAGGKPHGSPAVRAEGEDCFNAAVLDLDGNSVEVIFHEGAPVDDDTSAAGKSRLLTWSKDVSAKLGDGKSAVSLDKVTSVASSAVKKALVPANSTAPRSTKAPSEAASALTAKTTETVEKARPQPQVPVVKRSFTAPNPTLTPQSSNDNIQISRKTLVGTILGAAAGAAVAYAMCRSEEDSAKAEHAAYLAAKGATRHLQIAHPHLLDAKSVYSSPAFSTLNASEAEYVHGHDPVRAIEAPPSSTYQLSAHQPLSTHQQSPYQQQSYQRPSYTTVITGSPPTEVITPPRSRVSSTRSQHSPPERRPQSSVMSASVPEEQPREASNTEQVEPERRSSHSSHSSHAKSSHSKVKSTTSSNKQSSSSKRSPRGKERSRSRSSSRAPQPSLKSILESREAESTHSKASSSSRASKRTAVLGRSIVPETQYISSEEERDTDLSDLDTVVPDDSVSQVGSSRRSSHRRHSSPSHHSHSSQSHHSHSSYHSTTSRRVSDDSTSLGIEQQKPSKHRKKKSHRSSESGSEVTAVPGRYADYTRDHLASHPTPMGPPGSIISMPVRGMPMPQSMMGMPRPPDGSYPPGYPHPHMHGRSVVSYYG